MYGDWKERLLKAIDEDGRSDRAISLAAGLGPNFVNQMRGTKSAAGKKPNIEYVRRIAEVIGSDIASIVGPSVEAPAGLRTVMVGAHVQAGQWAETWEWSDDDQYPVAVPAYPELAGFRLQAAETRGPSMNRRWPEGTVVVFTDVFETGEAPIAGKRYVVERKRASGEVEHTVKLLHRDSDGKFWLVPESDDPRYQTAISVEDGTHDGDEVAIIGRIHFAVTRE